MDSRRNGIQCRTCYLQFIVGQYQYLDRQQRTLQLDARFGVERLTGMLMPMSTIDIDRR
jgi:ferredoxin